MEFRKLTLQDRELYEKLKRSAPDTTGWEYSFDVLWIWNVYDQVRVSAQPDRLYITSRMGDRQVFYPPLTAVPADIPAAVDELAAYADAQGIPFRMFGLSAAMLPYIDTSKYSVGTDRGTADYIYSAADMMTLTGKKFHSKRNFVSRFKSKYVYEFRPYHPTDRPQIEALYDKWNTETEHETMRMERAAILRALDCRETLQIKIYVLTVADTVVAFSVTALDIRGVAHGIFEKGDVDYDGVYQTINNLTAQACLAGCEVVNRQEDMNIEGLRKAKLSYHPIRLQEKFTVQKQCDRC